MLQMFSGKALILLVSKEVIKLDVDMIKRRCAYNIEASIEKKCLQAPALLTS